MNDYGIRAFFREIKEAKERARVLEAMKVEVLLQRI
jgi:hypothetical protein